jgi:TonB family protein
MPIKTAILFLRTCSGLLLVSSLVTLASAQTTLSTLTIDQALQQVRELEREIAENLDSTTPLSPKDQFESTAEYNKRKQIWAGDQAQSVDPMRTALKKLQQDYYTDHDLTPDFVSYDADQELLSAVISGGTSSGEKIVFHISRAEAKQMYNAWPSLEVVRQLDRPLPVNGYLQQQPLKAPPMRLGLRFNREVYLRNPSGIVYAVGGDVSAPVVLFGVDPGYSEEARKKHLNGTVVLSIVVDIDGRARDIHLLANPGMGLDQKAIEAVQKWSFKPGMKDGQPVNVRANIDFNFRLF